MKWIGQHIYDLVSRFRDDVYLEGISTSTETDMLVVDSDNKVSKRAIDAITVDVSDFMTNGADNRVLTATGTDAMNAEANLTFDGTDFSCTADTVTFTSANADDPAFIIENTTVDDQAARLQFKKHRGVDAVDGDNIGEIEFWGYDDGTPSTQMYAKIYAEVHDATSGEESGLFGITLANHDGGVNLGFSLTGGSEDGEIDCTVGRGANSLTTIAGDLTVTTGLILDSVDVTTIQTSGESFADNDTSFMTSAAIDDAIIKGGSGLLIKVLPHQFMQNEEGGVNKSVQFDESGTIGVKSSSADGELFAFVEIPIGKTATSVTVYGSDTNNVVQVYELNVNASAALGSTDGSGNNITNASGCVVGTACDIVDTAATGSNYLVIEITVTSILDIVYGAVVTVSG